MTMKHTTPSKLEAFLAVAGAALGFSVLFMFALSSFVNMIYHRAGENASGHQLAAADTPHIADGKKITTTYVLPGVKPPTTVGKPAEHKPAATDATAKSPGSSVAHLLARANIKKGAKVAKKCYACHSFNKGGKNKVGPNLYAVVGKEIAVQKGFKYSRAMTSYAGKAGKWKYDNLGMYLRKPKKIVPKTKMAFAGIRKESDLANLIAFLRTNADRPLPLPTN